MLELDIDSMLCAFSDELHSYHQSWNCYHHFAEWKIVYIMWNDYNWKLWYLIWYPDKAFRESAVCLEDMMDHAGFSEVIVIGNGRGINQTHSL